MRAARKQKTEPHERPILRCAIYTRKSTEEGLDQDFNSLDAQREAGEAYIASQKQEGWVCLPDRYDDGGFSGGTLDRPALKRLLTDVGADRVDCIMVYKVDRLSRSLLDFARLMEALEKNGVALVAVTQRLDTSTSMGRLTLNMLLSFAQFEREIIGERTRDKLAAARKKGKWVGGYPILGYDIDPAGGRLLVNEAEAERVRAIFGLYAEKQSLLETRRELDRRGWTSKRWMTGKDQERGGRPFTRNVLHAMLTNPTYLGRVKHNGATYPGEHQAIVDEALWNRVQGLLLRNGAAGGQATRNKHGALLRGLLWCGPCDARMTHTYARKRGVIYRYYVCSAAQREGWDTCPTKSIPAGEIERFVVDRIRTIGTDPKLLAEVLRAARAGAETRIETLDREKAVVRRDLRQAATEMKRLVGSSTRSRASGTRLADLQEAIARGEGHLAQIRDQRAIAGSEIVNEADLAVTLKDFAPIWDSLSPREQARVVRLLVERVVYDAEKETVALTFRPTGIRVLGEEVAG